MLVLHPPNSTLCPNSNRCVEYECTLDHPPGRVRLCDLYCINPYCEFLHPKAWSPTQDAGAKDSKTKKLRTQLERDEFRLKSNLPILSAKDQIISRLKQERVLIVTATTGSGKTTQIRQYAAEAFPGEGLIVCTQPRVLAALSLARRIAGEFDNSSVGENVGYKVSGGKRIKGRKIMFDDGWSLGSYGAEGSGIKKYQSFDH
jgi:hypothetical protein